MKKVRLFVSEMMHQKRLARLAAAARQSAAPQGLAFARSVPSAAPAVVTHAPPRAPSPPPLAAAAPLVKPAAASASTFASVADRVGPDFLRDVNARPTAPKLRALRERLQSRP